MSKNIQGADILYDRCANVPIFLQNVKFYGIKKTKKDALIQEISQLYSSENLDELVKNSDLAATHMQVLKLYSINNCFFRVLAFLRNVGP